jgi:site-specific DNA-methyltransferase (adenine-specific)
VEIYHDHFQNYKRYNVPKAQLIIADIPYNIGVNAYASNPSWYKDGDNKNGESELAGKNFFDTDNDFRIAEFMHFVNTMLKKEPKEKNQAGCMIVFCEFEQQFMLIEKAKEYGFDHYINLVFRKNYSSQKSIHVIKNLIEIFTDVGDVVIDPCAGSGITLLAAEQLGRKSFGFEIKKNYVDAFKNQLANNVQRSLFNLEFEQMNLQQAIK